MLKAQCQRQNLEGSVFIQFTLPSPDGLQFLMQVNALLLTYLSSACLFIDRSLFSIKIHFSNFTLFPQ